MNEGLYWQEKPEQAQPYRVPDDVFDLVFRLSGSCLALDHAQPLAHAICAKIGDCHEQIGIHPIRVAESGNGWTRPSGADAMLYLSRRTRLVIRIHRDIHDEVVKLCDTVLDINGQRLAVGACEERRLSTLSTVFSHALVCDAEQPEAEFLGDVSSRLVQMNIAVRKMICGTTRLIQTDRGELFTRALLLADLSPQESVLLQQRGLGEGRLLGCGLFVPHKGINAV